MFKRLALYIFIFIVFWVQGVYLYYRGAADGINFYKHSPQFAMTLESQYRFGWLDGAQEAIEHGCK